MNSIQRPNTPHHVVYTPPVMLYFHELLLSKFMISSLNLQNSRATHGCWDGVWCGISFQTQKLCIQHSGF